MTKPVCVVVGFGPGNGTAFSKTFAANGYRVAMLSRSTDASAKLAHALKDAKAYACDVTDLGALERTFAAIKKDLGPVDTVIYNAGSGSWGTVEDITLEAFETTWRINTLGALATLKHVVDDMKARRRGSFILIGATASRRGGARAAAFASAKAAQRNLAESMARHLWPMGIHVAVVIIDGMVDLEKTRKSMPDKGDDDFLSPFDIAHTVLHLATQPKSAWSFEVEARPFTERW
jgi:NAD(P)-dependent dehydrogenase (short-subunit alcohol dehydrogenase family)